jgi:hypothetical protein
MSPVFGLGVEYHRSMEPLSAAFPKRCWIQCSGGQDLRHGFNFGGTAIFRNLLRCKLWVRK